MNKNIIKDRIFDAIVGMEIVNLTNVTTRSYRNAFEAYFLKAKDNPRIAPALYRVSVPKALILEKGAPGSWTDCRTDSVAIINLPPDIVPSGIVAEVTASLGKGACKLSQEASKLVCRIFSHLIYLEFEFDGDVLGQSGLPPLCLRNEPNTEIKVAEARAEQLRKVLALERHWEAVLDVEHHIDNLKQQLCATRRKLDERKNDFLKEREADPETYKMLRALRGVD